ncbi:MAG: hypothetical protein WA160_04225 [Pseudobdellovibrio sp.]
MLSHRRTCYCAFCKTPRKVYKSKNLSLLEIISLIFLSVIITHVVFRSFDPRGLGIVGIFLITGEIFTQLKWRTAMVCNNCGFDPVLYIRDQEAAGLKVKAFLAKRPDSVDHLLRPAIKLPTLKVSVNSRTNARNTVKPSAPSQILSLKV